MSRAVGNLKTCYLIQSSDAMDYLSLIRLASDFGMLPEKYRTLADRMFIEVQPGHVQLSAGKPVEPGSRDTLRAELLRKEFQRTPQLDPSASVS
jgi:protein arginine kinase